MADHLGSPVTVLVMNTDYLASGDEAGVVHIRKIFNDEHFHITIIQNGPVTGVLFSPDSESLFIASNDHLVAEWSLKKGEKVRDFIGDHTSSITSMA